MKKRRNVRSQTIIFRNMQAPGDVMMMAAALRDLHRCYPGKFKTGVETTAEQIWENNPYVSRVGQREGRTIKLGYPLIHRSNQSGLHFIQGFIDDINAKLNLEVRLTEFRTDLHWSKHELNNPPIEGDYWVILSGGKADFTTKWWDVTRYQEVVNRLEGKVSFVQIGNKPSGGGARHYHPSLNGAISMVGKTNLREAFLICLHARGIITPVTCFMHLAAAIGKPAIVIAGGREHYTWEGYTEDTLHRNMAFASGMCADGNGKPAVKRKWSPQADKRFVNHEFVPHDYFHCIGELSCCKTGGCWRTKVTEGRPEQNCKDVVKRPGRVPLPRCLDMITVDQVVAAVLKHEERFAAEDYKVPSVNDLIVKIPGADTPPPEQDPNPILHPREGPAAVAKKDSKKVYKAEELKFRHLTFPITVCGLTFGDHTSLALRCLDSLYNHIDPRLFRLRFAMNEPTAKMKKLVTRFLEQKDNVERLYVADPQIYKYPMMRRMFHDPTLPLTTDWVMWFDDDSHITEGSWIKEVGGKVDEMFLKQDDRAPKGHHCYGKVYYFHFRGEQEGWMKKASWYTGRDHNLDHSKRPPMPKSDFCTGGFWLVSREAIMACDWPDPRIKHRGGDIMFGAALQQQGYGVVQAYKGVKISDARQRGYNEDIVGTGKNR